MQQEAIEVAKEAMDKYTIEKDIAQHIKKEVRTFEAWPGAVLGPDITLEAPRHMSKLTNVSSSTHEKAQPGTALSAGTSVALSPTKPNISSTCTSVTAPSSSSRLNRITKRKEFHEGRHIATDLLPVLER